MRRALKLLVALTACWLALWALATAALPRLVEAVLHRALPRLERAGIAVDSVDHGAVNLDPTLTRATARDVSAVFDLSPTDDITLSSTFEARLVSMRLASPIRLRGHLTIDQFEVTFHETDRPRQLFFDRLTNAHVHVENLPLLSPRSAVREIYDGLQKLFLENAAVGDLEFRGDVVIRVRDLTFPAQLYTERQGDTFRLRFRQSDVEAVAAGAQVELSPEQVELVSLFPIRAPFLLRATLQAKDLARNSFPRNPWLQDALRHVSWSFLLTREFGPEFAREVTDAQETRPGNTPEERSMDFHNNAVGRRFAADGIRLADLPELVRSHPDVIRHPDEIASRVDLRQ